MKIREALIHQSPSIALQREAAAEIARLDAKLSEVHSWIVCAGIADADDMMQNAHRIEEITRPPE